MLLLRDPSTGLQTTEVAGTAFPPGPAARQDLTNHTERLGGCPFRGGGPFAPQCAIDILFGGAPQRGTTGLTLVKSGRGGRYVQECPCRREWAYGLQIKCMDHGSHSATPRTFSVENKKSRVLTENLQQHQMLRISGGESQGAMEEITIISLGLSRCSDGTARAHSRFALTLR